MKKKFPNKIPIFPLSGVIYFPKTNLPLNIFEKRYLDLVNDTYRKDKLMGMIQSKKNVKDLYEVGCLGKISDFVKNKDGRVLINLTGVIRFKIVREVENSKLYREFEVEYNKFDNDITETEKNLKKSKIELSSFFEKVKIFFKKNGLILNWNEFDKLSLEQQINTLAMISPISNEEKQKLLETVGINEIRETLSKIIEFYIYNKDPNNMTVQ
tara:strand:+ start:152 stop:787 length:636 start_codon:yes stop_codon:yes gene_type:complete